MLRTPFYALLALLLSFTYICHAQTAGVKIPTANDKYSRYVQQLEGGKTDIDYTDFRNSYLQSKQYTWRNTSVDSFKKLVRTAINNNSMERVVAYCNAILSIDYTSLFAHKCLQQSYQQMGDSANYHKYHDIEFGLLNSIMKSGDGKTCETGWHVIQIAEEYFILSILGGDFEEQALTSGKKNACDRMTVKDKDGQTQVYYFEINKVLEMEHKMFMGK